MAGQGDRRIRFASPTRSNNRPVANATKERRMSAPSPFQIRKSRLVGREGFEPSTPGLKVRACAPDPSGPTSDSNSAVMTAWTD